jgi:hypothetical protein
LLQTRYEFDYTVNPDMPSADAMRMIFANGGTKMFANIPGLRNKDFTYERSFDGKDKQVGRSFYIFTNKKDLDAWL